MEARGFHTRGYLPHIESFKSPTFVTFRQADSLPAEVLVAWQLELAHLDAIKRKSALWKKIEAYLDAGAGSCLLRDPANARKVQDSLVFAQQQKWLTLIAWAIMPNHVHFVADFHTEVGKTMQSIKRFTSRQIGPPGTLWQREYFDRLMRSDDHLNRTTEYIEWNPVKANLCDDPKGFPFSSAFPGNQSLVKRT